jgi:seryl-tRNA synthetase
MIDILFVREHPDIVKKVAQDKRVDVDVDRLLELDKQRREAIAELEEIQRKRNEAAKAKDIATGKSLKTQATHLQEKLDDIESVYTPLLESLPNIPSDDTPIGADESENVIIKIHGEPTRLSFHAKDHLELGEDLGIIDTQTAAQVSGARFSYLKGALALMQFGLVQLTFQTLTNEEVLATIIKQAGLSVSSKPFVPVVPPVFIRPEVMHKMARLEPREERYHITSDDLFLVGSAEHALGPLHMGQTLDEEELPLRYIGYSTAFRREAGSYGKDTRGIMRVHQFDKLEMESFSNPETSIEEQNFFVAIQEYLVGQLGIPYRLVQICTGDMGTPDARQIDLEMWMPGEGKYRETHTSDLMTDYQSRRLLIRSNGSHGKRFVHMNDATAFAIGRTLIAIMENYQQEDGTIRVPEALVPFVGATTIS